MRHKVSGVNTKTLTFEFSFVLPVLHPLLGFKKANIKKAKQSFFIKQ